MAILLSNAASDSLDYNEEELPGGRQKVRRSDFLPAVLMLR